MSAERASSVRFLAKLFFEEDRYQIPETANTHRNEAAVKSTRLFFTRSPHGSSVKHDHFISSYRTTGENIKEVPQKSGLNPTISFLLVNTCHQKLAVKN